MIRRSVLGLAAVLALAPMAASGQGTGTVTAGFGAELTMLDPVKYSAGSTTTSWARCSSSWCG